MHIVNAIIKNVKGKNRWIDHSLRRYFAYRKVEQLVKDKADPILVYQMGKVGSSTIHNTLVSHGLGARTFHIHFLSADIAIHKKFLKKHNILPYHEYIYFGEVFRKHILKNNFRNIKVISLVREPIGLIVSNLFENSYQVKEILDDEGNIIVEKAKEYLDRELKKDDIFRFFDEWFDREIKAVFDLDVFSRPFDKDLGFHMYPVRNGELLIMRTDVISDRGPALLKEFLGLEEMPVIQKTNVREMSSEAASYKELTDQLSIKEEVCRRIYQRPLARHFFTDEMIEGYINSWAK